METMDPAWFSEVHRKLSLPGVVLVVEWWPWKLTRSGKSSPCAGDESQSRFPSVLTIKLLQHSLHKALG